MPIQQAIRELESLGPLPAEDDAADELLDQWEAALDSIQAPITDEEAVILCGLLGPDLGYGLGWTLLRTVETAPGWFLEHAVVRAPAEWSELFRIRNENYNFRGDTFEQRD